MAADMDDLLPGLDLADVMQQRPMGLGSVRHVVRVALAVTVSWALSVVISRSTLALFAPVTTLLVVQASAWTTLGVSIQRILGTGIGVLAASIWVNLVGLTWWSFLLGVGASLLIARMLPWSLGGQLQIPVAVVFVLALGPGTITSDLWRVIDVLIGGAVGLAAVFIYPPKPRTVALDAALRTYRDAIVETLRAIGGESGSLPHPLADGEPHDYVGPSRQLRSHAEATRTELVRFVEGAHLNLRARGLRDTVQGYAVRVRRLGGIGVQLRGLVGAANRMYDRSGIEPVLTGEQLDELIGRVAVLMDCVLGGPGEPVASTDPGRAAALDAELEEDLRRIAEGLVEDRGGVRDVLGSVSILGRLDLMRVQLMEFAGEED